MDVEGAEAELLRGSRETISRLRPRVLVENHEFLRRGIGGEVRALLEGMGLRHVVTRPYHSARALALRAVQVGLVQGVEGAGSAPVRIQRRLGVVLIQQLQRHPDQTGPARPEKPLPFSLLTMRSRRAASLSNRVMQTVL